MLDIGLWLADVSSGANCETGSAVAAWPLAGPPVLSDKDRDARRARDLWERLPA